MSTVRDKAGRPRDVDFQHLGAEELGSIYESLLELVPNATSNGMGPRFELRDNVSANDRKTTGSYYTPSSLIESLLDTALDPVIDEHAKSGNPDDLLKITVCDPACGSGHFLVAAARRIAKRYAALATYDHEPVPSAVRGAMHKVVGRCVYGVDLNPLAAELAKVSLWIESLEPGKPLAFLDAHIKVGNALLGNTPTLLAKGVPDVAFKAIEGDDKAIVTSLRKQNAKELAGQDTLFDDGGKRAGNRELAHEVLALATIPVTRVADVREQERRFREFDKSKTLTQARRTADAWCAAFVWHKHADAPPAITTATVRRLEDGGTLPDVMAKELDRLVEQYRFFHWHLEFPEIFRVGGSESDLNPATGWAGGFTCVLGNPPWDSIAFNDTEFFESHAPDIASTAGAARKRLIKSLPTDNPLLADIYRVAVREIKATHLFVGASGSFPLNSRGMREVKGVNTYKTDALFVERTRTLVDGRGRLGLIVPTGVATDAGTQFLFRDLAESRSLVSVYDFENRGPGIVNPKSTQKLFFASVDSREKFILLTATGLQEVVKQASFAFYVHDPEQLNDSSKQFALTPEEIAVLNPNTGNCPIFRTRRDMQINLAIYRRVPILLKEGEKNANPWGMDTARCPRRSCGSCRPVRHRTSSGRLLRRTTPMGRITTSSKRPLRSSRSSRVCATATWSSATMVGRSMSGISTVSRRSGPAWRTGRTCSGRSGG